MNVDCLLLTLEEEQSYLLSSWLHFSFLFKSLLVHLIIIIIIISVTISKMYSLLFVLCIQKKTTKQMKFYDIRELFYYDYGEPHFGL